VPRQGLDRARVVGAAADIADAEGLDAVTLARVAAELGVRSPSLYNHVAGRDGLLRGIAAQSTHELAAALRRAATGRAGADAIAAVAQAQRAYALAHPGRYATTVAAPVPGDAEHETAAAEAVEVLEAVLDGMGLTGEELTHGVRALRSAVHGFAALEAAGGFGLAVDRDASFRRLVDALASGIAAGGPRADPTAREPQRDHPPGDVPRRTGR
jgi:AcrR family transcriptional regulator